MCNFVLKRFRFIIVFALLATSTGIVQGDFVFDFEDQPSDLAENGSLSLLFLSQGGLGVDILRSSGTPFDVLNLPSLGFPDALPETWGNQALSPFVDSDVDDAFIFNFSQSVNSFSIEAGDFGGDFDTITIEAFSGLNGGGSLLASDQVVWGFNDLNDIGVGDDPALLALSASGIQSVVVVGGSNGGPNSIYYDNVTVTIPEPGCTIVLTFVLFNCRRRNRISISQPG